MTEPTPRTEADPWEALYRELTYCVYDNAELREVIAPYRAAIEAQARTEAPDVEAALAEHYRKLGKHGTPGMSCDSSECAADIQRILAAKETP